MIHFFYLIWKVFFQYSYCTFVSSVSWIPKCLYCYTWWFSKDLPGDIYYFSFLLFDQIIRIDLSLSSLIFLHQKKMISYWKPLVSFHFSYYTFSDPEFFLVPFHNFHLFTDIYLFTHCSSSFISPWFPSTLWEYLSQLNNCLCLVGLVSVLSQGHFCSLFLWMDHAFFFLYVL